MKKFIVAIIATAAVLLGATACEVPEANNKPGAQRATTGAHRHHHKGKHHKAAPQESAGQANARAKAEDYLSYNGFSRKGLIQQLKFEGFNLKDATYGADAVGANWNKQAVRKAKEYLDQQSFSRAGLIQQLKFEGFTPAQAEFGVNHTGL